MKKLFGEFFGTFLMMFIAGNAVISLQPLAAVAIGATYMLIIYAGGPAAGGYYNPAVSLALWRRGRLNAGEVIFYVIAQVCGAVAAALLVALVQGEDAFTLFSKATFDAGAAKGYKQPGSTAIFLAEGIWTMVLAYVVLLVSARKKQEANQANPFFGLIIGSTLMAGALALGTVSGGVFNPAVILGYWMLGVKKWLLLPAYLGGQLAGGFLGATLSKRTSLEG